MKILGIIAEYNPFHKGHLYHLHRAKEKSGATHTVILLSPSFTQRGEIAVIDKWSRAQLAVRYGADLVLEMPTIYATMPADIYGQYAVKLFDQLGVIDVIAAGIEAENDKPLKEIAELLYHKKTIVDNNIRHFLKLGYSYQKSMHETLKKLIPNYDENVLSPNNTLYIQYLRGGMDVDFHHFLPIQRIIDDPQILSAGEIRKRLIQDKPISDFIPYREDEVDWFDQKKGINRFYHAAKTKFLLNNPSFSKVCFYENGMENLLLNKLEATKNYSQWIDTMTSKRYPVNRIQRFVLHTLLNVQKNLLRSATKDLMPLRILASTDRGFQIVKKIKEKTGTELSPQYPQQTDCKLLALEHRATDFFFYLKTGNYNKNIDLTYHFKKIKRQS